MTNAITLIKPKFTRQSGVALVISLVMLLVITLIAISGLTNASNQAKMATNAQQHNQTFQAAEGSISATFNIINATDGTFDITPLSASIDDGPITTRNDDLSDNSLIEVTVTVTFEMEANTTPGFSLNADENSTSIAPHIFNLKGEATLADSGATTTIEQGIMYE